MNSLLTLKQKQAAAVDAAKGIMATAVAESRAVSADERSVIEGHLATAKGIEETIALMEKVDTAFTDAPAERRSGRPGAQVHDNAEDKPFESFGHQLLAVVRAERSNGRDLDPRLHSRAISGMSETVPADGGFLVHQEFSNDLIMRTNDTGILLPRCTEIPLSNPNSNGIKIPGVDEQSRANGSRWGGVQAFWANEAGGFTGKQPKFREVNLVFNKLTGLCYATDELLSDAAAIGKYIQMAFSEEFGFKIDDGIYNGDGVGKPLGFMNSQALVTVSKESGQASGTVLYANIVKMFSRLYARSRKNAVWLINQDVEPQLYQMFLATGSTGVAASQLVAGQSFVPPGLDQYARLFGLPVIPVEQAQTLSTLGDIALVDLTQYGVIKRDVQSASSIHVRFLNDEQVFRFIYRIDAQPLWHTAITPFKGTNTQSPYITLQAR